MKKIISIFVLLHLAFFCTAQNSKHSEIRDLGYIGKIHSVTTKIFQDSLNNKKSDSLISTKTRYYNKEGNATEELFQSGNYSQIVNYEYKNGIRRGYSVINKDGETKMRAEIIHQKEGYITNIYILYDKLIAKNVYKYDEHLKIKTVTYTTYNIENGKMKGSSVSTYYHDKEGFISGYDSKDLFTSKTDTYRFQILRKDAHKNPDKLILLKNNLPFQIHLVNIEYRQ